MNRLTYVRRSSVLAGIAAIATPELLLARQQEPDEALPETIRRLTAYAEAGADCLYAPGIRTEDQIRAVVNAVAPKPVNVLVGGDYLTVAQLAALGVRRISVGGTLARTALSAFLAAAEEIAQHGTFTAFRGLRSVAETNQLF